MGEAGMKILITGAHGFVGRNLTETLKAVRDGKDRTRGLPTELELLTYTRQSPEGTLEAYCAEADFVFHLAGVNRPETEEEFLSGNRDLTARLLSALEKADNPCPVLLTSSIQALRDKGRSVLLVSHHVHQAYDVADRFLFMDKGRTVGEVRREGTSPADLTERLLSLAEGRGA